MSSPSHSSVSSSHSTEPPVTGEPLAPIALQDTLLQGADLEAFDTVQSELPPHAQAVLQPSSQTNHYELIRELGRGAMGTVYLARDTKLGRLVAIKFLNGYNEVSAERFIAEARMTAQCQHENIVVIHDVDKFQGQPYMVLEYLEGQSLRRLLQGRRIPVTRAVELIVPVVRALQRAHEFNIVHRDLKPDNIIVTDTGTVKVLDFGIAKPLGDTNTPRSRSLPGETIPGHAVSRNSLTVREGKLAGTVPYMSPEQWGADTIDCRTDLWAVGLILFEMLAGRHPLDPLDNQAVSQIPDLEKPMPRLRGVVADAPAEIAGIVDRCLHKRKAERFASAAELLDALEPLLPGRYRTSLDSELSPYAGLAAFQEADADRFFGRERDVARMLVRIREHSLVGVVGPSGVGKSSFIRAGVIPALKRSGEAWEIHITRPGRKPLAGLASLLAPILEHGSADEPDVYHTLVTRLERAPGYLAQSMRAQASARSCKILLFVDQFEELYTLVPDRAMRQAFIACLMAMADHTSSPLRVAVSMRSDFLDRAAEDRDFIEDLTGGLIFLAPPDREGLRAALTLPAEMHGYRFDPPDLVDEILSTLEATSGALPLLQFAATKLWDARDRKHQRLTRESYAEVGGIAGALASHADSVLASLAPRQQRLVRAIFLRLVTPERTRALIDVSELRQLDDPGQMQSLIDHLINARLLVAQTGLSGYEPGDDDATVELVHESLIDNWPTLGSWLEQHHEHVAFITQLRSAAAQWHSKGKSQGLLWRGEAVEEARRFQSRFDGELSQKEREYLEAVLALADRSRRIKRGAIAATIIFLTVLVAAAAIALILIRNAEKQARLEAEKARAAEALARSAESNARANQRVAEERLAEITATREQRDKAQQKADDATAVAEEKKAEAAKSKSELIESNRQLRRALESAQAEKVRAERESESARKSAQAAIAASKELEQTIKMLGVTNQRLQAQLDKERALNRKKEKELDGLSDGDELK